MGKCHFCTSWLEQKDNNNYLVKEWGKKQSEHEMFCCVCTKTFSISKGFEAVMQHSKGKKHTDACRQILSSNQIKLQISRPEELNKSVGRVNTVKLYDVKRKTTENELLWTLKCVSSNFSAASLEGIDDLFSHMYEGEEVKNFTLSTTKFRYLLTEALSPYFSEHLKKEAENKYYTLMFDETTNSANAKELRTGIKFWSDKKDEIVTKHLQTFFIGSATGEILFNKLLEALNNSDLPLEKLIMLGSDGPNVNKTVKNLMNAELIKIRKKGLIEIGSCNIHVLHNAFLSGLNKFGMRASDFILEVHAFFDDFPSRWEDFRDSQKRCNVESHRFLKHVESRWLTIEDAGNRILEQWSALNDYFLKFVPNKKPEIMKSRKYLSIVENLKRSSMELEIIFVCCVAHIFTRFTGFFQREEPLIHIMHEEIQNLAKTLLLKICKPEAVKKFGADVETLKAENLLKIEDLHKTDSPLFHEISADFKKLNKKDQTTFLQNVQQHFKAACHHVIQKSALNSDIIKYCSCLDPKKVISSKSHSYALKLAKSLSVVNINYTDLSTEWRLMQTEIENLLKEDYERIDYFWAKIFAMKDGLNLIKFPNIKKMVEAALSLSHGNADIERGFSASALYLTDDKASMKERTLNAAMVVKSALKDYNNKPQNVPITEDLIKLARSASKSYKTHLEEEKKLKELEEKKKEEEYEAKRKEKERKIRLEKEKADLIVQEKKLKLLKAEEEEESKTSDFLLKKAKLTLKKAMEKKNLQEATVAEAIIEGLSNSQKKIMEKKKEIKEVEMKVEKRKNYLIENHKSESQLKKKKK